MKFEFGVSPKAEFSIRKFLIITQEIPHIFCVSTRWNWQNRPILTILNLRLTCLRFCDAPFIYEEGRPLPSTEPLLHRLCYSIFVHR